MLALDAAIAVQSLLMMVVVERDWTFRCQTHERTQLITTLWIEGSRRKQLCDFRHLFVEFWFWKGSLLKQKNGVAYLHFFLRNDNILKYSVYKSLKKYHYIYLHGDLKILQLNRFIPD